MIIDHDHHRRHNPIQFNSNVVFTFVYFYHQQLAKNKYKKIIIILTRFEMNKMTRTKCATSDIKRKDIIHLFIFFKEKKKHQLFCC